MDYLTDFYKLYMFPSGALTSKPYTFGFRPWELKSYEIFDPTTEFYQPIAVNIMNNMIQRVLPVNSNIKVGYNWIPNKLRFFFESIVMSHDAENVPTVSAPSVWFDMSLRTHVCKTRLIRKGWSRSLTNLAVKLFNLSQISSGGIFFSHRYHNADLFSAFEFSKLIFKVPFLTTVTSLPRFSLYDNFATLFSLKFREPEALFSQQYFKVFLISFNPYFLDPVFNYYLRECVSSRFSVIYTLFSSCSITNLVCKNVVCTLDTLVQVFSGRHDWSCNLGDPTTLVVVDPAFMEFLPFSVSSIILKFVAGCPERAYIPTISRYNFTPLGFSQSNSKISGLFQFRSAGCPRVHSFFFDVSSTINWEKNLGFKTVCISSLTSLDSYHVLDFDLIRLSQFYSKVASEYDAFVRYSFPISSFVGFSTVYKLHSSSLARDLRAPVFAGNYSKPVGVIFQVILRGVVGSQQYGHYVLPEFLFPIFIFSWFFYQNSFLAFFLRGLDEFNFWGRLQLPIGCYKVLSKWYIFSKFCFVDASKRSAAQLYRSVSSMRCPNSRGLFTCYFDFGIFFLHDVRITGSKTLMLERAFFRSRFINFAR